MCSLRLRPHTNDCCLCEYNTDILKRKGKTKNKTYSICNGCLSCLKRIKLIFHFVPLWEAYCELTILARSIKINPQKPLFTDHTSFFRLFPLNRTSFELFTRQNPLKSQTLDARKISTLKSAWTRFRSTRQTKVIIHGFLDNIDLTSWMTVSRQPGKMRQRNREKMSIVINGRHIYSPFRCLQWETNGPVFLGCGVVFLNTKLKAFILLLFSLIPI